MTSKALVIKKNLQTDGSLQIHNFQNKYQDENELQKPSRDVAQAINEYTRNKINEIIGVKTKASQQKEANNIYASGSTQLKPQYIKYTPNQQGQGNNSGATQRIIKMHQTQVDPLAPNSYKNKRIPGAQTSPPPTIMHSPNRKLTAKDMQDWKIPPCVSNWKNQKGYIVPLEQRIAADGRLLQNHTVNEKFAQMADSLYQAERVARQEIEERIKLQKKIKYKEYIDKEKELIDEAKKSREEKNRLLLESQTTSKTNPEDESKQQERDFFRYILKRETEREMRQEQLGAKKSKQIRDSERDISEKIALGQAQPTSNETMYDQRLFNQTQGLDSGFVDDEEYNLYDKPLFQDRTAASIYKNVREVQDDDEEEEDPNKSAVEKVLTTGSKRKGFEGANDKKGSRTRPVEFERHGDDYFGLGSFDDKVEKKVKK